MEADSITDSDFEPNLLHNVFNSRLRRLSPNEIVSGMGKLTRNASIHAYATYPHRDFPEYPEVDDIAGAAVAHIFALDITSEDEMSDPKRLIMKSIQYSLGGRHSSKKVLCHLLDISRKEQILCNKLRYECM